MTHRERVLVVSVDGLAPRWISPGHTPRLCALAQSGAACFRAETVDPPITLPAHASMLRGVGPDDHGVLDNTPRALDGVAPSFLAVARDAGLTTAAIITWGPLDCLIEPGAARFRSVLDGGYDPAVEDRLTMAQAREVLATDPDVAFVYLQAPDVVGHAAGWDSDAYGRAVQRIDGMLGELVDLAGPDMAIVVTTDHGGIERDHQALVPEVVDTFVVVRSARVGAGGMIERASVVDIAPTVSSLAGVPAPSAWTGTVLVGTERPAVDVLLELLAGMADHAYGERVDMLTHALQTAAAAASAGGGDDLVLAGLLHDIGHVLGDETTAWGLPDHAAVGARFLRPWLPGSVVRPIEGHVDAKRALVAIEPDYAEGLSRASVESLRQQGGPFTADEVDGFLARPGAEAAMTLRRFDDGGKVAGLDAARVGTLADHRDRLAAALARPPVPDATPMWARGACVCPECRDPGNGQRLLTEAELDGWEVTDDALEADRRLVTLRHADGRLHRCEIPTAVATLPTRRPFRIDRFGLDETRDFLRALAERGAAIVTGLGVTPGEVLRFAARIGFVRSTNYGDLFDVVAEPRPVNLAYTPRGLPLHTDNPYRDPVPTVQLLHCLRAAADGGASRFADGVAVAEQLRVDRPRDFAVLSSTPVMFRFAADGVDLRAEVPIISVDARGAVVRVTVNNRSLVAPEPGAATERWYRALGEFTRRLDAAAVDERLAPGELIAFDNRRVLHGRTAFAGESGRHLQGCYIDIDAVESAVAAP